MRGQFHADSLCSERQALCLGSVLERPFHGVISRVVKRQQAKSPNSLFSLYQSACLYALHFCDCAMHTDNPYSLTSFSRRIIGSPFGALAQVLDCSPDQPDYSITSPAAPPLEDFSRKAQFELGKESA